MQPTYSTEINPTDTGVLDEEQGRLAQVKGKVTDALGRAGRRIKRIEVRETIVERPFPAVGIAAAAGALIAVIRPMPNRGRVSSMMLATIGAIGLRLIKDAALGQLGDMAKNYVTGRQGEQGQGQVQGGTAATAQDVRTTTY